MDVIDAVRKRRAVRNYIDTPVPEDTLDRLLRLALSAPTGSGAQAWSLLVVRDPAKRRQLADIVIDGGAQYFAAMRYRKPEVSVEDHAQWGRDYAEQILASYRIVPVWIVACIVPRNNYPETMKAGGYEDDVISVAFAMENLMLVARAEGLGTVPTTAFQRFEIDRLRAALELPADVDPVILTPLGYPQAFPEGKPPALVRTFKPWKTLVHDDIYGAVREQSEAAG